MSSVGNCAVIRGHCDPRFVEVQDALERCFRDCGETGAAVGVYYLGELVCDLRGGVAKDESEWVEDTLIMPYSVSKPFAALCCLILIDQGLLNAEDRVTDHWPEFGQGGKGDCTVRMLLEHMAGIPFVPDGCELRDLLGGEGLVDKMAAQVPVWPPGEVVAEHAMLYGNLCGALVEKISGITLGQFFKREVSEKLGLDLHFGLPESELHRCAEISQWPPSTMEMLRTLSPLAADGLFKPDVLCTSAVMNSAPWRQAEIPAVNMHGTAGAIARVYALLANGGELSGVRLLQASTVALLRTPGEVMKDQVFGFESAWSLGFQHHPWELPDGTADGAKFGLGGIGGSSAFGSFEHGGVGFAYVTRQMGDWERACLVEAALLQCLRAVELAKT